MSTMGSPLHTFRCLLRELRYLSGTNRYRETAAYFYIRDNFRKNTVTSEKFCRAQQEMHFQASTYLCLLRSVRNHVALHEEYHGKGERSTEEAAHLVGLKLPQQPGGKGWER
ncbi:protein FMC1 homolog [Spea bombifrons]|uniref:protein FMC1 homolog n=1 Tax=Spea bombifrons TaxID=233779 RepID=UPI002349AB60|nr:protein FMC1 homolog [Spea bombifrons]